MNIYNITIPIYAATQEEADQAQRALRDFVSRYRDRGIAVTGNKVRDALASFSDNGFIRAQIDTFLTRK